MSRSRHVRRHSCQWKVLETRNSNWDWKRLRYSRREQVLRCVTCGRWKTKLVSV